MNFSNSIEQFFFLEVCDEFLQLHRTIFWKSVMNFSSSIEQFLEVYDEFLQLHRTIFFLEVCDEFLQLHRTIFWKSVMNFSSSIEQFFVLVLKREVHSKRELEKSVFLVICRIWFWYFKFSWFQDIFGNIGMVMIKNLLLWFFIPY